MEFINKVWIKLFTLVIVCDIYGKPSICCGLPLFNTPAVNINVPTPIGNELNTIPGLLSIFKTNKRYDSLSYLNVPVSLNVNVQPYQQYAVENYQYMPPRISLQEGYYYPPPSGYYYHGFYAPATPPPSLPQPPHPYWHHPQYPQLPRPNNRPVNPSVDQNPYLFIHDTTKMPLMVPIQDLNQHILRTPSPYREKSKGVITPDSPFYVNIPEEPTIYGIELRR